MSVNAEDLARLHRLHEELQEVDDQLASGPKQVQRQRIAIEKKQVELESQKQTLITLRKAADASSLQLKSNEARIATLRGKLNAASSNREYEIIKTQIDADSMANSVLEDEILEMLEKVDVADAALTKLKTDIAQHESREKAIAGEVAAAAPGLNQRRGEVATALKAAERVIPASVRDSYNRLVKAHGAGSLASSVKGACNSCFSLLSPQERVQLNTNKIVFCRACGRLLYRDNPPPAADDESDD